MPTPDFSRHLFQPEKRYVGTFLQQGRVLTDEDLNAHRRLHAEEERLALRDIICAKGTPNGGFLISGLATTVIADRTVLDFQPAPGSYYLGGLRFAVLESWPETFLRQSDWLQIDADPSTLPAEPPIQDLQDENGNAIERYDLVYLRAWEQDVSAVEDSELLERALGGPDTSVYRRRMRRFEILPDVPGNCAGAFEELVEAITAPLPGDNSGVSHHFDEDNCELQSKARLTVGFSGTGPTDDLCRPKVAGGYLGAENQAIRVQLTAANRFIWGYDNASPLYRVQVTRENGLNTIRFLTLPRDEFAQPKTGQAIEILPWGAILPNLEKVAELGKAAEGVGGHLATVETSYDPDSRTLQISQPVPGEWIDWLDAPEHADYLSHRDEEQNRKYFYLRVWTGGSGDAAAPDFPFTPGTAVELAGTGLEVTFSDFGLPRDHWIIAARPNTPDRVVPWELLEEAAPAGPRFFFGGLALIRWRQVRAGVVGQLVDCRTRFRPLCQIKGCCTVIVGDGHNSHGEFSSIQDAIEALPPEGGEICVLRGMYLGPVRIADRENIVIRGCGTDTFVSGLGEEPVFEIIDSSRIEIRTLAVEATGTIGIHAHAANPDLRITQLVLAQLAITAINRAAIVVEDGNGIVIRDCMVNVGPLSRPLRAGTPATPEPAVYVQGDRLRIEQNRIFAVLADAVVRGFGGLHIGGDSRDVEIRRNHIREGNNNGITLGSVNTILVGNQPRIRSYLLGIGFRIRVDEQGCIRIEPVPPTRGGGDEPGVEIEAGDPLEDVRIIDNLIENMGMSGISVARFFEMDDSPDFITVAGLLVESNRIRGCMRLEIGEIPGGLRDKIGFGGVALADVEHLIFRDNVIENNGTESADPISGLFVLHSQGLAIDRNEILDNGRVDSVEQPLRPGRRGGIVLGLARAPVGPEMFVDAPVSRRPGARQTGFPAAHIHDNVVVSPAGRALEIIALGPVSVEGNEFTAKGSMARNRVPGPAGVSTNRPASSLAAVPYSSVSATNPVLAILDLFGGAAVAIFNLGVSNEVYFQLFGLSGLFLLDDLPTPSPADRDDPLFFVGGNILFNDNQVVFDAFAPGTSFILSSVLLLSLDDISMHGNQCDCDLTFDFALLNALVIGWSIRVSDNRFEEGLRNTLFSGLTLALMNQTTDNQSTHCLFAIGPARLANREGNRALVELFSENPCRRFATRLDAAYENNLTII